MRDKKITAKAEALLKEAGVNEPPVPVGRIAKMKGIAVRRGPLPEDLSGFLLREKTSAVIGVNSLHAKTRQAFTMAHELGHFFLHPSKNFVDHKLILFRDERSSQAVDEQEIDANQFAADLLMPERFVTSLLKGRAVDLEDEELVAELARTFGVSTQALMFRLINLNLARKL